MSWQGQSSAHYAVKAYLVRTIWKSTAESLLSEMALFIDKIAMYEGRSYLWKCPGTGIGGEGW